MKIFHGTDNAGILRGTVLTLGVFDGLHLGHQKIMQRVVERAAATDSVPTVITFDPHPRAVLYPENAPPLLQTLDQRLANFEVLGIRQTIVVPFDKTFAGQDAEVFLRGIVYERLQAREVYLGEGFAFGKNRGGNIESLIKISRELGFYAEEIAEITLRNTRISSSKIRHLLAAGKINLARRMLGRPYGIEGQIVHGFERGRTIGFPTANLKPRNRVISEIRRLRDRDVNQKRLAQKRYQRRNSPAFSTANHEPSIESYVFDFDGDLYGDVLRVRFLHRIRDEKKIRRHRPIKSANRRRFKNRAKVFRSPRRSKYAGFSVR